MATTYGAPGVYIEEVPSGSMPIEGVGTAVAAFVGFTQTYNPEAGDVRDPGGVRPQLVTSWDQYERVYGGHSPGAMLPYAVQGFFANGGSTCFIVRLPRSDGSAPSTPHTVVPAAKRPGQESLRIEARDAVSRLEVAIDRPAAPEEGAEPPQEFTLRVMEAGKQREEYPGLTLGGGARAAEKVVNESSTRIRISAPAQTGVAVAERMPEAGLYRLQPGSAVAVQAGPKDVEGSESKRTGYRGLAIAEAVTMVAVPEPGHDRHRSRRQLRPGGLHRDAGAAGRLVRPGRYPHGDPRPAARPDRDDRS